jgi:hypothetical protein
MFHLRLWAAPLGTAILAAVSMMGTLPAQAAEANVKCRMTFNMSGWSIIYKTSSGTGNITCSNGQSMGVSLKSEGGGLTVGKSTIENGIGEFSAVTGINEILGSYASAEAHAGAVKSAKGQVLTKGEVSLALSGTGRGWDLGLAFGKFTIAAN